MATTEITTTIYLARHGQTDSNVTGFYMGWSEEDLNEAGYLQAGCLSARLAGLPLSSVYTSPLRRAYATAEAIARPHDMEPRVMEDLIEIRLGDWEGLYRDEIERRWPELWRQSRVDPSGVALPNGESFEEVTGRAVRAFEGVIAASLGREVVLVAHEVVVKVLVAHVLGVSNSIYRRFDIDNASLSAVRAAAGGYRLLVLNDTSHLGD